MFLARVPQAVPRLAAFLLVFTVWAAAQTLQLVPNELTFQTEVGAPDPSPQTFRVESTPPGQAFAANVKTSIISAPFLNIFPTNGATPGDVTVSVDASGFLQAGRRTADIEVVVGGQAALLRVMIEVLPAGEAPRVTTAPPSLQFSVSSPGQLPQPQPLVVRNEGGGILDYEVGVVYPASGPQGWLNVNPADGSVSFETRTHQVSVSDTAGLAEGDFTAQIILTGGAVNTPFSIPVTLTVGASPNISVIPTSLSFSASEGGGFPPIQTLTVRNEGGGALVYTIDGDQDWLNVRPPGGDASASPVIHDILPDIRDLPQGTYLGNLAITSANIGSPLLVPVTLIIGPPSRLFTLPSSVDFLGAAGLPIPEKRLISIVNTPLAPGSWRAHVEPSEATWVKLSPAEGRVPGHLMAAVDTTGLGAAPLEAEIVIEGREGGVALGVEGTSQGTATTRIPIRLTLLQRTPALGATPEALRFEGTAGDAQVLERILRVDNDGGPQLQWDGAVETDDGGAWLSVNPGGGVAPTRTRVAVNTSGLGAGVRHGRILLSAGNQKTIVPVVLVLAASEPRLDTDVSSVYWETTEGGPAAAEREIRVLNRGTGVANWRAQVRGSTGGANWLSATPTSGVARSDDVAGPATFTLTPNTAGLAPGVYGALVEVREAPGETPRLVSAMLRVAPAGRPVIRTVQPGGLSFLAVGQALLPEQPVRIRRNLPGATGFQTGVSTVDGGSWLRVSPDTGETTAAGLAELNVGADPAGLLPGVYRGQVGVTFGDGLVESVWATLIVPTPGPGSCRATAITIAPVSPHLGFRAIAGRAVNLEIELLDNCGRRLPSGAVMASFNNGDRALALEHLGQGRYAATWAPGNAGSQANIALAAASGAFNDRLTIVGSVEGSPHPRLSVGGVVNGAGFAPGRAISAGAIVSVFGRGFSTSGNFEAPAIPLPTQLGQTRLLLGGAESPLYFVGPGQMNAHAPNLPTPGTTAQAVVRVGAEYTVPEELAVASAAPGLFVSPSAVGPDRAIVQNQNGSLNGEGNPARRGEAVVVYLAGIGETSPPVAAGEGSPAAEPLARAAAPFTITVGGVEAAPIFLGLTPNFVGLAQANFFIPAGAPIGPDVPLVVTVDGQPSNVLVLAVAEAP